MSSAASAPRVSGWRGPLDSPAKYGRGVARAAPRLASARASAFDPDLVEMLLQRLVLVAAVHALAMRAIDGAPIGLDDDTGIPQDRFDINHDLAPLVGVRHRQRLLKQGIEFRIGIAALVPRHTRFVGQRQHLDAQWPAQPFSA